MFDICWKLKVYLAHCTEKATHSSYFQENILSTPGNSDLTKNHRSSPEVSLLALNTDQLHATFDNTMWMDVHYVTMQ